MWQTWLSGTPTWQYKREQPFCPSYLVTFNVYISHVSLFPFWCDLCSSVWLWTRVRKSRKKRFKQFLEVYSLSWQQDSKGQAKRTRQPRAMCLRPGGQHMISPSLEDNMAFPAHTLVLGTGCTIGCAMGIWHPFFSLCKLRDFQQ